MEMKARDALGLELGKIVAEAGKLIMALQASEIGTRRKPDGSPFCQADLEAEQLILARLAALLPNVGVIAEELFAPDRGPVPERFLLVDPLDGTREFLAGHKDFTVNIALIEAGHPIAGAICAPALESGLCGRRHRGAGGPEAGRRACRPERHRHQPGAHGSPRPRQPLAFERADRGSGLRSSRWPTCSAPAPR